jgi:hypothetical protein
MRYRKEDAEEESEKSDDVKPRRGEVQVTVSSISGLNRTLLCLDACAVTESPAGGDDFSLKSCIFDLVLVRVAVDCKESSFPSTCRDRPLSYTLAVIYMITIISEEMKRQSFCKLRVYTEIDDRNHLPHQRIYEMVQGRTRRLIWKTAGIN